ncbi:interleukin-23 receptor [Oenanthe melanoleuca]|uniref:interleukin-23 receptor n=1 Tax=Oenanthe melanoleuca TaxID=2939378 RepID=UPI0024C16ECC|nr:interleukin-23 receptor [Oenanthe melanoleuca]
MAGSGGALLLPVLLCCLCPGAASIECRGRVWVEPAPVVPMGSDISIGCQPGPGCPSAQLLILLNYSHAEGPRQPLPGGALRLRLRDFRAPLATATCFSRCAGAPGHRLECGTELRAGYPPDPPGNLSCAIAEGSERLECAWDAGRDTHLETRHSLHLRRVVAQDEQDEEEKIFPADSAVLLRELNNQSHYSGWVQASNALGTARSALRLLILQELVVPALPVAIGADTSGSSPPVTTTRWRSRTRLRNVRCQERHRATGTPTWQVEPCDTADREGPRWQHELQSDTEFEFQARCRLSSARSPWSAWSPPFLYSTPEAAPAAPAVWRRLGPVLPDGSREVTVLFKPLPARGARGRILGYAVSWERRGAAEPLCLTSGTECTVRVPPGARSLLVTARNSRGTSSPASIPLDRAAAREEFPAPGAVEVKPEKQSRVLVRWEPPQHSQSPPVWFILEWLSSSRHGQQEQLRWERVPGQETHTYIPAEAAAGAAPRVSLYAVYPQGISTASSSPAPAEEPHLGSTYSQMSQDDDIRVFLGLSLSMVGLSVLFAIVMFKKSVRKRVKATLVSLLPEWLFEDFPHLENSTVVKSLQERGDVPSATQERGDVPSAALQEPFLTPADPVLTQIQEVPAEEQHQSLATEVAEPGEPPGAPVAPGSPAPERLSPYKPQLCPGSSGYVAAGILPAEIPEEEVGILSQGHSSPVPRLWGLQAAGPAQVCLLERIHLVLSSSQGFPARAGAAPCAEPCEPGDVPQQMLVPQELLSCLRATHSDTNPRWEPCSDRSWDWG